MFVCIFLVFFYLNGEIKMYIMHCNASAAKGIIPYQPGRGDRSALQRWQSVIYCLVVVVVVVVRPHRSTTYT